jgi:hypothetical protein
MENSDKNISVTNYPGASAAMDSRGIGLFDFIEQTGRLDAKRTNVWGEEPNVLWF